ncbi:MAG: mandelate racemase [Rhodobacteraceae bacterium]|nr:mandelate racemase [Paracoccaceae bacterium]
MASPAHTPHDTAPDLIRDTRVRDIQTTILDVPTTRRHKLSNTAVTHQNYVHVRVRFENGVVGYGEAATLGGPRWSEESVEAIKANIDTYLAPALIGAPGCQLEAANLLLDAAAKRNTAAKSALNAALLDALGRTLDLPATALLGGAVRDRISVIWALASGDVIQEVEEAKSKIAARQFNRFKIKLGFADIRTDLRRLERLRAELPEGTEIIADINQGWSEADCRKWLPALEALDLSLIEQPLEAGNLAGMARLAKISRIPLMLDEGVFSPQDALHGAAMGAGSVLSLKLCKHGSTQALQRVAGVALAGGQELYGGCLLESSLGAAAHVAVFATLPSLTWGCEHFGPLILSEDTTQDSLVYEDFHVLVPQGPGLGVVPDADRTMRFQRTE